jgi:hypothetical protein
MKKLAILLLAAQLSQAQFLTEDHTQIGFWVDPTVTDKGFQLGVEIQKIMHWGFVGVSLSHYEALDPNYTDIVGFGGINFNLFAYEPVRYYGGIRAGALFRGSSFYPLVGIVAGFDWEVLPGVLLGLRGWIDHREDQKAQFYGDYSAYKRGWITDNPLLQENGAIVVSFRW